MILVVSHAADEHTRAVLGELRRQRARARLLDLAQYPAALALTLAYSGPRRAFRLRGRRGRALRLEDIRAVWWRRPQPFVLHRALRGESRRVFAWRECREAWDGAWLALDARWVNHPLRDEAAAHKPWQLKAAQAAGLAVPRTCVTSDPREARDFVATCPSGAVFKALQATRSDWRETRLVRPRERRRLGLVRFAPVIFQEYVPGVDVRVTIVGRRLFAAEIDARDTAYPHDFRPVFDRARVSPLRLPPGLESALLDYASAMGLAYATVDLRRDRQGRWVFLEANPSGQWLFVEARTEQPITTAVARLLATGRA